MITGVDDIPEFEGIAKATCVCPETALPKFVEKVTNCINQNRKVQAIVLECTELGAYANEIRRITRMPVFDALTLV